MSNKRHEAGPGRGGEGQICDRTAEPCLMRSQMISREHQSRAPAPQKSKKAKHPEDYSPPIASTRALVGSCSPPPPPPLPHRNSKSVLRGKDKSWKRAKSKLMREKEGGVQPFRRPEEKGHLMSFTRMHTHWRACGARVPCHYPHKRAGLQQRLKS